MPYEWRALGGPELRREHSLWMGVVRTVVGQLDLEGGKKRKTHTKVTERSWRFLPASWGSKLGLYHLQHQVPIQPSRVYCC